VIGAGIAGCAAALSLAKKDLTVVVLERMQELSEIGAGIQASPNLVRIMHHWGLSEQLSKEGVILKNIIARRW